MAGQTLQKQPSSGAAGEFGVGGTRGAPCLDIPSGRKHLSPGDSQGAAQPHCSCAGEHL